MNLKCTIIFPGELNVTFYRHLIAPFGLLNVSVLSGQHVFDPWINRYSFPLQSVLVTQTALLVKCSHFDNCSTVPLPSQGFEQDVLRWKWPQSVISSLQLRSRETGRVTEKLRLCERLTRTSPERTGERTTSYLVSRVEDVWCCGLVSPVPLNGTINLFKYQEIFETLAHSVHEFKVLKGRSRES